ncbi:MAG TPA: 1-acyl-sn-glycerol-3-phosphate acyltransferase [Candidatus Hydrogenedentes bacterium]|jgi:1-acyl-sn-glycerol-3-phosphate acyltransferase|nr:hypothetical protein [Candidatus Hydrogenedentota bacterium]HNZ19834.1 1-acyl-sn-glycerol-3-phosphate acyltransferase [Candidatus Hydrogenedentota bacterium]HOH35141.1 1-acyl-sn-glycerol-3-phosphate acyltransferase [Candidatus Hydrogenedentota bacterium]HPA04455.1 1-acyl-sn-glycerol-3-phosphate acyltransferase [Candidatus Hydrogenedentota bacterium]
MNAVHAWITVVAGLAQYLLHRLHLAPKPDLMHARAEFCTVIGHIWGWRKRLRVVHGERCPRDMPCVFAQNHVFLLDPFVSFGAAMQSAGILPRFMSRDDFFAEKKQSWWYRLVNVDELICQLGTLEISRGNVSIGQLRPFVNVLRNGESFIMYPGRTRSRSGLIFEYRGEVQEPGSASFFLAQAQRGRETDLDVAIVPLTRTRNVATGIDTVLVGHPLRLAPRAGREEQRALDFQLVEAIAQNVTVNATQLAAGILYLHALHGLEESIGRGGFEAMARAALERVNGRYIDPDARADLPGQVSAALRHFRKAGLVVLSRDSIRLDRAKILATPPMDGTFRKLNPVKYSLNQVLHFADVTQAIEDVVLTPRAQCAGGAEQLP